MSLLNSSLREATRNTPAEKSTIYQDKFDKSDNLSSLVCPNKEELFEIIADFSKDWVYWINPDESIEFVSPSSKFITGYSPEEFLADIQLFSNIIIPEDLEIFNVHRQKVIEGNPCCSSEFRIITKSGELKWIAHECQSVYDDQNRYLGRYISNRDITEIKKEYHEKLSKEKKLLRIYDNASLGNYQIFPNGNLRYANKNFLNMLGYYTFNEIADVNIEELSFLNLAKRTEIKNKIEDDGIVKDIESMWLRKDHNVVYVKESITAYKNIEGKVVYYEGITQDITEQKKGELRLYELSQEAKKLLNLKTEFLATISHEIRTPLNAILNFTQMLKSDPQNFIGNDFDENVKIIENEGKRIQRTIDLVLEMSLLVTDMYDYKMEELDLLEDVILPVYEECRECAQNANVRFSLTSKIANSTIFADKHSVYQIFSQLVENAIKYSSGKEVKIIIGRNAKGKIYAEVIDTGIGISEEYIPYLFTVFSQEDNSYSRMFEGTGLGLAIVKRYCDLNDAVINVESSKGNGSTFTVTFLNSGK